MFHWVANNARYGVLAGRRRSPNLGSRALALNLERLSAAWQRVCGPPIVWVASFVDEPQDEGTACKASYNCNPASILS